MSWQTYVDEHLMCDIEGTGQHLTSAAILGLDGTVWAQSSKFPQEDEKIGNVGGYLGIPAGAIAVEFDMLMDVEFNDVNGNHLGVDLESIKVADLDSVNVDLRSENHEVTVHIHVNYGLDWDEFFQFKPEEMKGISKEFDEPGTLAPTGLFLAGAKYMVIQGEPGAVIRGKKGAGGICIKKTGQALVMGIYDEPVAPGQCNMVVERLGDYLVDQGM